MGIIGTKEVFAWEGETMRMSRVLSAPFGVPSGQRRRGRQRQKGEPRPKSYGQVLSELGQKGNQIVPRTSAIPNLRQ